MSVLSGGATESDAACVDADSGDAADDESDALEQPTIRPAARHSAAMNAIISAILFFTDVSSPEAPRLAPTRLLFPV